MYGYQFLYSPYAKYISLLAKPYGRAKIIRPQELVGYCFYEVVGVLVSESLALDFFLRGERAHKVDEFVAKLDRGMKQGEFLSGGRLTNCWRLTAFSVIGSVRLETTFSMMNLHAKQSTGGMMGS